MAVIVLVGKLLEPLWGAVEMLLFFGVVNVGVAVLSSFFYYVLYMVTFNTELLFEVHIHGQSHNMYITRNPEELLPNCTGFSSEIGTKLRDWAVGQARGSCYSLAALSSNDSKTLYTLPYLIL